MAVKERLDLERENTELRRLLAERTAERDEALAQQTATAEVLQVINASPGDLAPVFDTILERALRLCEASFGALHTFDGEAFTANAQRGYPAELAENMRSRRTLPPREGSLLHRLVLGEDFVQVEDISASTLPSSLGGREALVKAGARAMLWIALRKDGALFGAITIYRQEARPFTDKQIALLQNFAAQAVIAMENARLLTETREALEQQTATAEVLQVINSSPGELVPVFDAMLERATRLCEADFGTLWTFDRDRFWPAAGRGHGAAGPNTMPEGVRPAPGVPLGRLIAGENVAHVVDVATDDAFNADPVLRSRTTALGTRSALAVALRKDDALLGAITASRKRVEPYSEKQIALLQNFAAQAVIAMENARLITETREALEQQTATAEVLGVINSNPGDLAPVFDAMLERAMRLCGFDHGSLQIYDGELFRAVAVRGLPEPLAERLRQGFRPSPHNPMSGLLRGDRFVQMPDLTEVEEASFAVEYGSRSLLCVPLRKDDVLLGQIVAVRQEVRPFGDKEIALLENFAAQAVVAMENARLLTETREALEQQTATAEVLQVINSSPGDLAPVFEAIVERATALCGADYGGLRTFDGEHFPLVAMSGQQGFVNTAHRDSGQGSLLFEPFRRGEHLVHIPDVRESDEYHADAGLRERLDLGGVRTWLGVALHKDDGLLGVLVIYNQEVRPFRHKQIALAQNFAAQAVIAMENARLLTETREALEQQTATAEVLQVINSSPGDLAPVFDAMLEKALRLCQAAAGTFWVADGEKWHAVAIRGMPDDFVKSAQAYRPSPHSPVGRLASGEELVHLPDLAATEVYRSGDALVRAAVDRDGVHTLLSVPLGKEGRLLGVFSVYRREVRPFSDNQIGLVQNFAAQAVIAMENARLITETREALDQQTATAEVLGVINSSPGDLAPVFDSMLDKAMRLCEAAHGHLYIYNGDQFAAAAVRGDPSLVDWIRRAGPVRPRAGGPSPLARIIGGDDIVQVADALAEEYRADPVFREQAPGFREQAEVGGFRTLVTVALRKDARLLGAITVYRQEVRPFTDKQIALLQNFAAQAVIAIENARLLGELRQRNDEIAGWNRELEERVAAQVGELERAGKLKRFLAPQLAELIVARGDEGILETHRRDIVVVFCDLRGFTAFAETAEPEEVLDLLREYHAALGPIVAASEGTLDHFSGDGIMVFFNDPLPIPDASERAVKMAIEMRAAAAQLQAQWRRQGREIGFGVGIARGYATLGQIGFAERVDYTAIGTVCNLAARLCAEAKDGQILISRRVAAAVEGSCRLEEIGDLALKGLMQAVAVYNIAGA